MVPFSASTDFGSVRHPEEVVYSLNDSCSHFTQRLFPPKVPQQHTETIPMLHDNIIHTYVLYITFIRTLTYFILHVFIRNFISSDLHGRLAALGSLFLLQ
jgi:hypothetical protein